MGGCSSLVSAPVEPRLPVRRHKYKLPQPAAMCGLPTALKAAIAAFLDARFKCVLGRCSLDLYDVLRTQGAWAGLVELHSRSQARGLANLDISPRRVFFGGDRAPEYQAALRNVTDLRLNALSSWAWAERLSCFPSLTALQLRVLITQVFAASRELARLSALRSVKLRVDSVAERDSKEVSGLQALAALPLEALDIFSDREEDARALLPALVQAGTPLRSLRLLGMGLPAGELELLSHLTRLTDLEVCVKPQVDYDGKYRDEGVWRHLPASLTSVCVNPSATVRGAPLLPALRTLAIHDDGSLDSAARPLALAPLAECSVLERLDLATKSFDEEGLTPIALCASLRSVSLDWPELQDEHVRQLEAATQLQSLSLLGHGKAWTTVSTDAVSATLARMSNLTALTLVRCPRVGVRCLAPLTTNGAPLRCLRAEFGAFAREDVPIIRQGLKQLRVLVLGRGDLTRTQHELILAELGPLVTV